MIAVVETMTCQGCKEVVDVLIGQTGREGPTGDSDYDKDLLVCPRCRSKGPHSVGRALSVPEVRRSDDRGSGGEDHAVVLTATNRPSN